MPAANPPHVTPIRQRLYRGVEGLLAPFRQVDDSPAAAFLTPEQLALFRRMSTADRAHSLRVYAWLQAHWPGNDDLLTAGLLHDCGKAAAHLAVWQRTLKVLMKKLAPARWRRLSAPTTPEDWRYPFYILAEHPRIGAEWAADAGCSQLTCWLIANHENDISPDHPDYPLLQALQQADASS
jgi:hypothetical protein